LFHHVIDSKLNLVGNNIDGVNNLGTYSISTLNIEALNDATVGGTLYVNNTINTYDLVASHVINTYDLGVSHDISVSNNINMNNNPISNLKQTPTRTNAATNYVIPIVVGPSNNIATISFTNTAFTQVYSNALQPQFSIFTNDLATSFSKVNFNFQFSGRTNDSNNSILYFYFSLSNVTKSSEFFGTTFTSNYPYVVTGYLSPNKIFSLSYQDIFDFSSGGSCNNDTYSVNLYVQSKSASDYFVNDTNTYVYQFVYA
jgi:hypothetical protein